MNLGELTFGQLIGAIVVLVVLLGAYNTFMSAWKNHLEMKKQQSAPLDELKARVDTHDKMLANDKRRLEENEERLAALKRESSMMLRGVRALLSHEINGNSDDKLMESYEAIDEYLVSRN